MSADTRGYLLTFRCLNCGRHEAFASFSSEVPISEEDVKTRILEAVCRGCGWKGQVCGVSAVRIDETTKADVKSRGQSS
jgi:Pyruvate/2-oxoacid:ferredoxin oxidoreductase delta subunit